MRLRPGMRRGTEDLMLQVVVSTTQFGAEGVWGNTMSKCIPKKCYVCTDVAFQSQERAGF